MASEASFGTMYGCPGIGAGLCADLITSHASFSFCKIFLRWLTLRKKKNSLTEKLRVSLLEKSKWLAGCWVSFFPNVPKDFGYRLKQAGLSKLERESVTNPVRPTGSQPRPQKKWDIIQPRHGRDGRCQFAVFGNLGADMKLMVEPSILLLLTKVYI